MHQKFLPGIVLLMVCFMLTAANISKPAVAVTEVSITHSQTDPVKHQAARQKRGSFLQRMLHKLAPKRFRDITTEQANRRAKSSFGFGIAAVGSLLLGFAVPFIFILAVPLGIVAAVQGSSALKNGTTLKRKARWGRGLGLVAAILTVVAVVVIIAAFASIFGG